MTGGAEEERAGRSALLLGATGLVGSHCLDLLLAESRYDSVRVLSRSPLERRHGKLEVVRMELDAMAERPELFRVDDVYCCLGTTMARAGSETAFRRVDHDYPLRAAQLAAAEGADQYLLVSAIGADPHSRILYNRVKGEVEAAVKRLPFRAVWLLRPSLLVGERAELRIGETLVSAVAVPLSPLLVGRLRRYRPIAGRDVARAMLHLALEGETGGVVESDEIAVLAADD